MKRIYVIAMNYQRFQSWCRDHNISPRSTNVRYVHSAKLLWGTNGVDAEFVFADYQHPEINIILQEVQIIRSKAEAMLAIYGNEDPQVKEDGMFTSVFWKRTLERVIRSFAASLIAAFTAGNTVSNIDWQGQLTIAGGAAIVSLLLAVIGTQFGDPTDPSFTNPKPEPPKE